MWSRTAPEPDSSKNYGRLVELDPLHDEETQEKGQVLLGAIGIAGELKTDGPDVL
jgi:hypothetical protein